MKSNNSKIWYSAISHKEYEGDAPALYDMDEFAWCKTIEQNHTLLYEELQTYLKTNQNLQAYFNQNMVSKKNAWKTISLMAWGVNFQKKMKHFPQTMKLLNEIDGLVSVSFNLLEAHSTIKPHFGDTNAIVRCHFGLEVPGSLPEIGFRVKNKSKSWENGKLLGFCDGYEHEAWNNTDSPRFILLFDVILPAYKSRKNSVCSTVLASLFLQFFAARIRFKKTPPNWLLIPLFVMAKYAAWITRPMYNFFGRLMR